MRKSIALLVLPLALSACATGPSLQSRMAAYTGASGQKLVEDLGVPDKQITVNGVQYFAYDRHHEQIQPDDFGSFGPYGGPFGGPFYGGGFYSAGFPRNVEVFSCETTFMLKDDKVFNFTLRGNDCG